MTKAAPAPDAIVFVGETFTLRLEIDDQYGNAMKFPPDNVTWVSSAPEIAKVDRADNGYGIVTGMAEGRAEVSAKLSGFAPLATDPVVISVETRTPTAIKIVMPKKE